MATQGMVTITKDGRVVMKIVAGCEGFNANKVALAIAKQIESIPELAMDPHLCRAIALGHDFGCESCLLVCDQTSPLCESTFGNPFFNPRWSMGTVPSTALVVLRQVGGVTVMVEHNEEEAPLTVYDLRLGACPKCGKEMVEGEWAIRCGDDKIFCSHDCAFAEKRIS